MAIRKHGAIAPGILRVSQGAKLRFTNPITHITPLPAVPGWIRQIHHLLQDRILIV